jgi:hypothetical protein
MGASACSCFSASSSALRSSPYCSSSTALNLFVPCAVGVSCTSGLANRCVNTGLPSLLRKNEVTFKFGFTAETAELAASAISLFTALHKAPKLKCTNGKNLELAVAACEGALSSQTLLVAALHCRCPALLGNTAKAAPRHHIFSVSRATSTYCCF